MKIFFIIFFLTFYISALYGVKLKLSKLKRTKKIENIVLYKNHQFNTNLENIYIKRLSDKNTRSSVRYHNSLYINENDFKQFKDTLKNIELP